MEQESLDGYRLSPQQRRLWLMQSVQPAQPFGARLKLGIDGPLDRGRLRRAVEELVSRHEILRTCFRRLQGMALPLQVIGETAPCWQEVELPEAPEREREERLEALCERCFAAPIDLEQGPALHAFLVALSPARHLLLLSLPALCSDRESLVALAGELCEIHGGAGRPAAEPLQYADLAEWQNELLESEETAAGREYWQQRSLPAFQEVSLPLALHDRNGRFEPRRHRLGIADEVARQLRGAAARLELPLATLLLAAWNVLLWRLTGSSKLVVGTAFDGRKHQELHGAVGLFTRLLPLALELEGEMAFSAVLRAAARDTAELHRWQEFFTWEAVTRHDGSGGPALFFPFGFEFQERTPREGETPPRISLLECGAQVDRFEARLSCFAEGDRLGAEIHYDASRVPEPAIRLLAGGFAELLRGVAADPELPIAELGVLGEAERLLLLRDLNPAQLDLPEEPCVHRRFESWAAEMPGEIALSCDGEDLTYAELNERANRLAHHLRAGGAGPDAVIALHLPRSAQLVVGLLAVLKAGAAYLPLDPALPVERLAFMLAEAGAAVLVTAGGAAPELRAGGRRVIDLDAAREAIDALGGGNPAAAAGPLAAHLVYVLFTSGSSGRPKAVGVEHRQLASYVGSLVRVLAPARGWAYATVSTLATDLGNTAVFAALCAGGRLHLISEERASDAEALADYCHRHPIDCLKIVPSHLSALLSSPRSRAILPRRWLILGGEACRWDLVERLWDLGPDCRLLNHYGPTETTVGVTTCAVERALAGGSAVVPLGRPLAHARIHVLDAAQRLVPLGVAGELCIGGAGLARGYLGRRELTAEKFVPDAYGPEPGARLYRSGDLARRRADGLLEFLGRIDQQLKIRGFRIEPAEIEAVLEEGPAVERAVVVARPHPSGEPRLTAYVVPDRDGAPAVRQWLRLERLGEIDARAACDLPNGWRIAELNRRETEYMYQEIFEEQSYLRHGIQVRPGDCVFDVGANIGLFSLFLAKAVAELRLYAFEPAPAAFNALRHNTTLLGVAAKLFECALSSEEGRRPFTFYPKLSMLSSLYAADQEEREVVTAFAAAGQPEGVRRDGLLAALIDDRLERREFTVQLKTLSAVLREHGIARVDLLKLDVQKSELDVLAGIDGADWPKIRQLVVEVHALGDRLQQVAALLEARGFAVHVESGSAWSAGLRHVVYAVRRPRPVGGAAAGETAVGAAAVGESAAGESAAGAAAVGEAAVGEAAVGEAALATPPFSPWHSPAHLAVELARFARAKLPQHMVPAAFVLLDELPRNAAGKLDRGALPEPPEPRGRGEHRPPRTPIEQVLAEIWEEVLGTEQVGLGDDFFALGGHSLLATQVVSRVRRSLQVDLSLRLFLDMPTLGGLAAAVGELLQAPARPRLPPLAPAPRERELPLSFAQARLWFLQQLEPASAAYNLSYPLRLEGDIRLDVFGRALSEIVRRHEVLRTVFRLAEGRPVQIVLPWRAVPIRTVDLTRLAGPIREAAARRLVGVESGRAFNLSHGPALRAVVVRLAAADHVGLLTLHHVVSDRWSGGILTRELALLYEAFAQGRPSPLPELPIQYADFACWQRAWLQGEALAAETSYWRSKLAGLPPLLSLPTDRPRPAVRSDRGAALQFQLPAAVTAALRQLSRKQAATPFITLLAAFVVLLHKYSGQLDVGVGTPIAGRRHLETEGLIGCFLNTLVLRADLTGRPAAGQLIERVREVWLEADLHQDLPFEKLVEELQPERSRQHNPIFQVLFDYGERLRPQELPQPSALRLSVFHSAPQSVQFDLALSMAQRDGELSGVLAYDTDLFAAATIARMAAHLLNLLREIAAHPDRSIADLGLLAAAELHQVRSEWNDTRSGATAGPQVHRLFEQQALRRPEAIALVCEGRHLSYGELDRRSAAAAGALAELGVGPESRVAVLMERSPELLIGILAVLRAGGAYLPLVPADPPERLDFMMADARIAAAVTRRQWAERFHGAGIPALCLDEPLAAGCGAGLEGARRRVVDANLAYVIYTSGSTGRPKAAMNTHGAIRNRLLWMQEIHHLDAGEAVLHKTPISFDVSVWELLWPLLAGARLIVARPGGHQEPAYLVDLIAREGVTTVHFVPSMLQVWLQERGVERCRALRRVICSGEALSSEVRDRFFERLDAELHNLYGPTEAAVDVTSWRCRREDGARVPIGRPIANLSIHLLDRDLRPVPVGVPGELHIGGAGLARGYLHRPDLTAASFIPDPAGGELGGVLYKTGDLARLLPSGEIDFLGRIDHQVKLRGFRIELGEIEAALLRHPAVREAVVTVREDRPGDHRLVAYVRPAAEYAAALAEHDGGALRAGEASTRELRSFLGKSLPAYMVPAAFVALESIPVSPSGKVDRRALPAPDRVGQESAALAAPSTPTEAALAAIWAEVLGLQRIGVDQSFFDLGGHSLLAMQVHSRIREDLHVELELSSMFDRPTIAELAAVIDAPDARRVAAADDIEQALAILESLSDEEARVMLRGMAAAAPESRDEPPL